MYRGVDNDVEDRDDVLVVPEMPHQLPRERVLASATLALRASTPPIRSTGDPR